MGDNDGDVFFMINVIYDVLIMMMVIFRDNYGFDDKDLVLDVPQEHREQYMVTSGHKVTPLHPSYLHICIFAYLHICIFTYLHNYIFTYLHIYIFAF